MFLWRIGGVLVYPAIAKKMEPTLLLPMGFGAILVNLPYSGAVTVIWNIFQHYLAFTDSELYNSKK